MKKLLTVLLVVMAIVMPTTGATLQEVKDKYNSSKKAIDEHFLETEQAQLSMYRETVIGGQKHCKNRGDLDNYTALTDELERFKKTDTVAPDATNPYVLNIVKEYQKRMAVAQKKSDKKHMNLLKRYKPALAGIVKKLLQSNNIDEAKKAREELDRITFIMADLEARYAPKPPKRLAEKIEAIRIENQEIAGRYKSYANGKPTGFITLHKDHAITNCRGEKKSAYRWLVKDNKLILKWISSRAVFDKAVSPGIYEGSSSSKNFVRLEKE